MARKPEGRVNLNDSIFGIEPNDHAIYLDTKQFLANQRQGTHKSKQRGEVAGSTRKIKRQKGTGTARAGSVKSPSVPWWRPCFWPPAQILRLQTQQKAETACQKISPLLQGFGK